MELWRRIRYYVNEHPFRTLLYLIIIIDLIGTFVVPPLNIWLHWRFNH
jgi:hypothetical protein